MGFVDHHVHLLSTAAAHLSTDVSGARSIGEVLDIIRGARPMEGTGWVRAWGYDESNLAEGRHPTRSDLDRAGPDRPVVLHHRTGHAAVLNTLALAGIGAEDSDGVLVDRHDLLSRVPRIPEARLRAAAAAVSERWAADGVTGFADATPTNGPNEIDLFDRWCGDGVVVQQITAMVGLAAIGNLPGYGQRLGAVRIGPVKLMPAGGQCPGQSPGQRPGQSPGLEQAVAAAHAAGYPVAVHVTEVDALEETLAAFGASPPPEGTRDRIEHNALCLPEQIARIAAVGPLVVVNPSFLLHRRAKYQRELQPVEHSWLIRIRSLIDAGIDVRAGSDSPVTPSIPREMVAAAMAHPFSVEESVDAETAARLLSD